MIIGAHAILYSKDADADRDFLRDVLKLTHVDVGHGWLIFGLPPAEVAVHPTNGAEHHELYLMTDDVERFVEEMKGHGIECAPITDQGWGLLTGLSLPGGGKLGVYQPRHASPPPMSAAGSAPASGGIRKVATRAKKAIAAVRRVAASIRSKSPEVASAIAEVADEPLEQEEASSGPGQTTSPKPKARARSKKKAAPKKVAKPKNSAKPKKAVKPAAKSVPSKKKAKAAPSRKPARGRR